MEPRNERKHLLIGVLIYRATSYICAGEYHRYIPQINDAFNRFLQNLKRA